MISRDFVRALKHELHETGRPRSCYLAAIVDMAVVPEEQRLSLMNELSSKLYPLLLDPELGPLQPLGALLIGGNGSGAGQYEAVLSQIDGRLESLVQAWITSVLPPAELALHLSGATYAIGNSQERYLLRYYDPMVTPVLYEHADREWVSWFFGPVLSWWFAGATQEKSLLYRIPGRGRNPITKSTQPLRLNDVLWHALESDPLPHRLLRTLETEAPHVFQSSCSGIRLAQIEAQLNAARQSGLTLHEDLIAYVMVGLTRSWEASKTDGRWKEALSRAVSGDQPLQQSLVHILSEQSQGIR